MNPRAPHYKFHAPASGSSNGSDLATVFGSLRTNFVPATVPASDTVSSPRDNLSLVKFESNTGYDASKCPWWIS